MVIPESSASGLPTAKSKCIVTYKNSSFSLHSFVIKAGHLEVTVNVIRMKDSVLIWLGNYQEPIFNDLSMAMPDVASNVISTKLFGAISDMSSSNMATRLSKKLGKQVLVSCNMTFDRFSATAIEKGITLEIKNNSDKF